MDTTAIDDSQKKSVQTTLTKILITAFEQQKITIQEMQIIANFILDSFTQIQTKSQMDLFLEDLKNKWPLFTNALSIYKSESGEDKESQIMNKLASYIQMTN